jgi:hypothetical protein
MPGNPFHRPRLDTPRDQTFEQRTLGLCVFLENESAEARTPTQPNLLTPRNVAQPRASGQCASSCGIDLATSAGMVRFGMVAVAFALARAHPWLSRSKGNEGSRAEVAVDGEAATPERAARSPMESANTPARARDEPAVRLSTGAPPRAVRARPSGGSLAAAGWRYGPAPAPCPRTTCPPLDP